MRAATPHGAAQGCVARRSWEGTHPFELQTPSLIVVPSLWLRLHWDGWMSSEEGDVVESGI